MSEQQQDLIPQEKLAYINNRAPQFKIPYYTDDKIRKVIQFQDGRYVTDDPVEIKILDDLIKNRPDISSQMFKEDLSRAEAIAKEHMKQRLQMEGGSKGGTTFEAMKMHDPQRANDLMAQAAANNLDLSKPEVQEQLGDGVLILETTTEKVQGAPEGFIPDAGENSSSVPAPEIPEGQEVKNFAEMMAPKK